MQIEYRTKQLQKLCTDATEATKKYGNEMAEKISQRIEEIAAADSIEFMMEYKIGRCHPLKGNRKFQYAVDLVHPKRLVFKKKEEKIEIAYIMEIIDYHN